MPPPFQSSPPMSSTPASRTRRRRPRSRLAAAAITAAVALASCNSSASAHTHAGLRGPQQHADENGIQIINDAVEVEIDASGPAERRQMQLPQHGNQRPFLPANVSPHMLPPDHDGHRRLPFSPSDDREDDDMLPPGHDGHRRMGFSPSDHDNDEGRRPLSDQVDDAPYERGELGLGSSSNNNSKLPGETPPRERNLAVHRGPHPIARGREKGKNDKGDKQLFVQHQKWHDKMEQKKKKKKNGKDDGENKPNRKPGNNDSKKDREEEKKKIKAENDKRKDENQKKKDKNKLKKQDKNKSKMQQKNDKLKKQQDKKDKDKEEMQLQYQEYKLDFGEYFDNGDNKDKGKDKDKDKDKESKKPGKQGVKNDGKFNIKPGKKPDKDKDQKPNKFDDDGGGKKPGKKDKPDKGQKPKPNNDKFDEIFDMMTEDERLQLESLTDGKFDLSGYTPPNNMVGTSNGGGSFSNVIKPPKPVTNPVADPISSGVSESLGAAVGTPSPTPWPTKRPRRTPRPTRRQTNENNFDSVVSSPGGGSNNTPRPTRNPKPDRTPRPTRRQQNENDFDAVDIGDAEFVSSPGGGSEDTPRPTPGPTRRQKTPRPTRMPVSENKPDTDTTQVFVSSPANTNTPDPTRSPTRKPRPDPTPRPTKRPKNENKPDTGTIDDVGDAAFVPVPVNMPNPTRSPTRKPRPDPTPRPTKRPENQNKPDTGTIDDVGDSTFVPVPVNMPNPTRSPTRKPRPDPTPRPTKRPKNQNKPDTTNVGDVEFVSSPTGDGVASGGFVFANSLLDESTQLDGFEIHSPLDWTVDAIDPWTPSATAYEGKGSVWSGITSSTYYEDGGQPIYSNLTLSTDRKFEGGVLTFKIWANSLRLPTEAFFVTVDGEVELEPSVTAGRTGEWVEYSVPVGRGSNEITWVHVYNPFSLQSLPPLAYGEDVGLWMDDLRLTPFTTTTDMKLIDLDMTNGGDASWRVEGSRVVAYSSDIPGKIGNADISFLIYSHRGGTLRYKVQTDTTAPNDDFAILFNEVERDAIFGEMLGYESRMIEVPRGKQLVTLRHRKNPGRLGTTLLKNLGEVGTEGTTWLEDLRFEAKWS